MFHKAQGQHGGHTHASTAGAHNDKSLVCNCCQGLSLDCQRSIYPCTCCCCSPLASSMGLSIAPQRSVTKTACNDPVDLSVHRAAQVHNMSY